jgi:hypothetical protein
MSYTNAPGVTPGGETTMIDTTDRACGGCGGAMEEMPGETCSSQCADNVRQQAEADQFYAAHEQAEDLRFAHTNPLTVFGF